MRKYYEANTNALNDVLEQMPATSSSAALNE
jgi:hypothetical protein